MCSAVTPFSAHCISAHRISDQKLRTVMVRAIVRVRVRVRVRLGDAVVRNAVGRKVGNRVVRTVLKYGAFHIKIKQVITKVHL